MGNGSVTAIALGILVVMASTAHAVVSPTLKCKEAKAKIAASEAWAIIRAFGKNLKKGRRDKLDFEISKARSKFTKKFARTEASGSCNPTGDADRVDATVDDCVAHVITLIDSGKTSGHFPASGQESCWNSGGSVIPCGGTGQDGEHRAGEPLTYVDNGDGTMTDRTTGLMWEKKSDDGSIHDVDHTYTWDQAFNEHIAELNSMNFAGYSDWRVPNRRELTSIIDAERYDPAVDPVFHSGCVPGCTVLDCSCTSTLDTWTSTTCAGSPTTAWSTYFFNGYVINSLKASTYSVRAVRGGL